MSRNKRFREIADKLPPVPKFDSNGKKMITYKKELRSGADILKQFPEEMIKTKSGISIPINPLDKYEQNTPVYIMVDHFEALQYFYKRHGAEGVNRYIDKCFAYHKFKKPKDLVFTETKVISLN